MTKCTIIGYKMCKSFKQTDNVAITYTRICRIAPYFPNISYISSAVILYGRFLTYKILFTSGGRRTWINSKGTNN